MVRAASGFQGPTPRQATETAAPQNIRCAGRKDWLEPRGQSEFVAECDRGGLLGEQRVGSAVDREPIDDIGSDRATQAVGTLEETKRDVAAAELIRRGEAANPTTHDRDRFNPAHERIAPTPGRARPVSRARCRDRD